MLTNPYLNYDQVLSYNVRHHFLVGDRGIGKTYGLTRWLLKRALFHNEPFIWSRNTKAAIQELTKFNGMGFLANHLTEIKKTHPEIEPSDFTIVKSVLFYKNKFIGAFVSLGNFFSIKGINHDEIINFVFDEFMPERKEAIRVDYDYALKSIMQSIFRTRTNFKAFYTANVLTTSCSILDFFNFSITPIFSGQIKQLNIPLSAVIFYLQNLKSSNKEESSIKGDAFALANKYTESSLIINYEKNVDKNCSQDLKQKEKIAYMAGDQSFFLLREFNDKVAVIALKKLPQVIQLPCYALNKKLVFGNGIYDENFKKTILKLWNTNSLIFRSHYTLYQFTKGLFMQ